MLTGTGELTEIAILSANLTESKNIIVYEKNYHQKNFVEYRLLIKLTSLNRKMINLFLF